MNNKKEKLYSVKVERNTFTFKKGNAKTSYYGWDSKLEEHDDTRYPNANSIREYLENLLNYADANGWVVGRFTLELNKITDEHTRKEVDFQGSTNYSDEKYFLAVGMMEKEKKKK